MGLVVALIGATSFLAGLAVGANQWISAGWLVAMAVGLAIWLRTEHFARLDAEWHKALDYAYASSERLRHLPEAHTIPKCASRWRL